MWSCPHCTKEFKDNNCYSEGRYCAMNHDTSEHYGGEVVMRDLQIYCLWKSIGHLYGTNQAFFEYIKTAHEFCPDERINARCHSWGLKAINVTEDTIETCVEDTFTSKGKLVYAEDDNEKLKEDLRDWNSFGSHLYPAVEINGVKFRGTVNPDNVFEAICESFIEMPSYCR